MTLLQVLTEQFFLGPDSAHGPSHWLRVAAYGAWLAPRCGADPRVVELFALFHDCRRMNESYDPDHGERGGQQARRLHGTHFQLEPAQLELLVQACNLHTDEVSSDDPTLGACWDADRLDLDRVGVDEIDLELISTGPGRELAVLSPAERRLRVGIQSP